MGNDPINNIDIDGRQSHFGDQWTQFKDWATGHRQTLETVGLVIVVAALTVLSDGATAPLFEEVLALDAAEAVEVTTADEVILASADAADAAESVDAAEAAMCTDNYDSPEEIESLTKANNNLDNSTRQLDNSFNQFQNQVDHTIHIENQVKELSAVTEKTLIGGVSGYFGQVISDQGLNGKDDWTAFGIGAAGGFASSFGYGLAEGSYGQIFVQGAANSGTNGFYNGYKRGDNFWGCLKYSFLQGATGGFLSAGGTIFFDSENSSHPKFMQFLQNVFGGIEGISDVAELEDSLY